MDAVIHPPARRMTTGRLCLDLVSTVHGRLGEQPKDDLHDRMGLAEWLGEFGVEEPLTPADVERFQALRETVYRLAAGAATGAAGSRAQRDLDVALINNRA